MMSAILPGIEIEIRQRNFRCFWWLSVAEEAGWVNIRPKDSGGPVPLPLRPSAFFSGKDALFLFLAPSEEVLESVWKVTG